MNVLLHACCGPCSLEPVRLLQQEGHDLTILFFNPNIHPRSEYRHRLDTLHDWADEQGIPVIEGEWEPAAWEATAGEVHRAGNPLCDRCRACYRLRLEETARLAAERGFEAISSTLNVSPYQFNDIIKEETERAAEAHGLVSLFRDFRPNYPEATRRSREMGMYRQKFCGCHYSRDEAKAQREQRATEKAARRAAREAREAAEAPARAAKKAQQAAYQEKQRAKKAARRAARLRAKEQGE